jgi:hypothetical protein
MAEGQPRAASRDPLTTLGGMLESLVQRAMAKAVWSLVIGRRVFAVLASLALLLQVLTPPGFMVSSDPAVRGLVVCTGHGPLVVSPQPGKPAKAPRSTTPGPCVFAAHAATPPPIATLVPTAEPNAGSGASGAVFDLAPGCGLAAPPPPSQAPPLTSI